MASFGGAAANAGEKRKFKLVRVVGVVCVE